MSNNYLARSIFSKLQGLAVIVLLFALFNCFFADLWISVPASIITYSLVFGILPPIIALPILVVVVIVILISMAFAFNLVSLISLIVAIVLYSITAIALGLFFREDE